MRRGLVSAATVVALVLSSVVVPSVAVSAVDVSAVDVSDGGDPPAPVVESGPQDGARPDPKPTGLDAAVAEAFERARARDDDVVVDAATSPDTIVYAQPDGKLRTESSAGPVRARTADGWESIDTRLHEQGTGGRVSPAVSLCQAWVGTRGADAGVVSLSFGDGGDGLRFALPVGEHQGVGRVDGNRVVFGDASVEVGSDSVTVSWPAGGVARTVPVSVSGDVQVQRADGGWSVQQNGRSLGMVDDPVLVDADGHDSVIQASATRDGQDVDVRVPGGLQGVSQVTFEGCGAPRAESGSQDGWVSIDSPDSAHSASTSLHVGTRPGERDARAFLKFDTSQWFDQKVTQAHLRMYQHEWGSPCAIEPLAVRRVTGFPWSTTPWPSPFWSPLRWTHQPTVSGELARTDSWCLGGHAYWDVTQLADNWENGAWPDYGLRVDAVNGASTSTSFRRFWSGNLHEGVWHQDEPTMVVWGNYRPGLFFPDVTRRWHDSTNELATLTPNVSGFVSDWDSNHVGMRVDICKWVGPGDPPYHGVDNPLVGSPEHVPNVGECKNGNWQYVRSLETGLGEGGWKDLQVRSPALEDNTWYAFYLRAGDGTSWGRHSATGFNMLTDVGDLGPPDVNASAYPRGEWTEQRHPGNEFTLVGSPGTWSFDVYDNGNFVANVPANGWGGGWAIWPYNPPGDGWHTLTVYSINHLRQVSPPTNYSFGVGPNPVSVSTPAPGRASSRAFRVNAVGPPNATAAQVEWSTDEVNWQSAGDTGLADCEGTKCVAGYVWDMSKSGPAEGVRPIPVWMRVRFTLPGGSVVGGKRLLTAARNGFSGSAAVTDVGPAQVALSTGDMQITSTDAAVPGYGDVLTVGRVWDEQGRTTRLPGDAGVFGTGWIADLPGPDGTGAMSATVADFPDHGIVLLQSPGGDVEVYEEAADQSGAADGYQLYLPVGDTVAMGTQVQYRADRLLVQDPDGVVTAFNKAGGVWDAASVQAPGKRVGTSAERTPAGRFSWSGIGSGGEDCSSSSLDTALTTEGCRVLKLEITGGLARSAAAVSWDPDSSRMTETRLATYIYEGDRLASVTDDRTGLTTSYTYSDGHLATLTPASKNGALTPWRFSYADNPHVAGLSRLTHVRRARPEGGDATWRVVYDLPVNDAGWQGLPRLTFNENAAGQTWVPTLADPHNPTAPVDGTAVFGPDHPVGDTPAAADWKYGSLTYMDAAGRAANTAEYGDDQWLVTSTGYDPDTSQVTSTLSAGNRIKATESCSSNARTLCQYGPSVAARAALLSTVTTYGDKASGMQSVPVTVRGPLRAGIRTVAGNTVEGFSTTHNTYDEGAPAVPTGQVPYRLLTSTVSRGEQLAPIAGLRDAHPNLTQEQLRRASALITGVRAGARIPSGTPFDAETVAHRYTPDGLSGSGRLLSDTSGWTLRAPTATVVDPGGLGLTTRTLYNDDGAVVKQVQPGSSGDDAATTLIDYYHAGQGGVCSDKAEWNGLVCRTRQAADPSGGSGTLPVTTTTYDRWLSPRVVTETSGSRTRVTTTDYDDADRPTTVTVTGGAAGDAQLAPVTTTYAPDTGLPEQVSDGRRSTHTGYDAWGRVVSYTDASGAVTGTSYDPAGRVASEVNPAGATSYTYDDATSGVSGEHRGVLTGIDYHLPGSLPSRTMTRYGPDGEVTLASGPGGVIYTAGYDTDGTMTRMGYSLESGAALAGWTIGTGATGRTLTQHGIFADQASGPKDQVLDFGFDAAGRLTSTQEQTGSACVARAYTYRADGARTGSSSGRCGQTGTSVSHTLNQYGQITSTTPAGGGAESYDYDVFGRVRVLPGIDSPDGPQTTGTDLSYFADDQTASTSHTTVTTAQEVSRVRTSNGRQVSGHVTTRAAGSSVYTQDPEGRLDARTDIVTTTQQVTAVHHGQETGQPRLVDRTRSTTSTVNHYSGPGDSPGWDTTGGTLRRYLSDASGALTATVTTASTGGSTGVMQLCDPGGSVALTLPLKTTPTVDDLGPVTLTSEYGQPTTIDKAGLYAWHGAAQRPTSPTTGLIQMGVRMYNPATGQFLTVDPIPGGNTTPYTYPQNPLDDTDLSGESNGSLFWQGVACTMVRTKCLWAIGITQYVRNRFASIHENPFRNAQRHFIWNVMLIPKIGVDNTLTWTHAHESGVTDDRVDSYVDQHNNYVSRTRYAEFALRDTSIAPWSSFDRAKAKFNRIWKHHPKQRSRFYCRRRSGSVGPC